MAVHLVHHHLTQHDGEVLLPPVGQPSGLHVHKLPGHRVGAVEVKPGVEQRRVEPGDRPALGGVGEGRGVQLRLVRHVHAQLLQVVHVVRVGGDLVLSRPLPGQDEDPVDRGLAADVDHPHGLIGVVVVEDGAVGEIGVLLPVHGQGAVAVLPLLPAVALVVGPGVPLVRLVRN